MDHTTIRNQIRDLIENLTGQSLLSGPPPFPGSGGPRPTVMMPVVGGPNLTDKVFGPIYALAQSMATMRYLGPIQWNDFQDGWRDRFATAMSTSAFAWGLDDQIQIAIDGLIATKLIRMREPKRIRYNLLRFTSHFLLALSMYAIGLDPSLLDMTEEERRTLLRQLHPGLFE